MTARRKDCDTPKKLRLASPSLSRLPLTRRAIGSRPNTGAAAQRRRRTDNDSRGRERQRGRGELHLARLLHRKESRESRSAAQSDRRGGKYRSSVDAHEPQNPTNSEEYQRRPQGVLYIV
eukprot:10210-Prorocentrum_minimum.AAC.8